MDEETVLMLRYLFDGPLKLHPKWNLENRFELGVALGLDDEQLDALHELGMWICNHNLEYALGIE